MISNSMEKNNCFNKGENRSVKNTLYCCYFLAFFSIRSPFHTIWTFSIATSILSINIIINSCLISHEPKTKDVWVISLSMPHYVYIVMSWLTRHPAVTPCDANHCYMVTSHSHGDHAPELPKPRFLCGHLRLNLRDPTLTFCHWGYMPNKGINVWDYHNTSK